MFGTYAQSIELIESLLLTYQSLAEVNDDMRYAVVALKEARCILAKAESDSIASYEEIAPEFEPKTVGEKKTDESLKKDLISLC